MSSTILRLSWTTYIKAFVTEKVWTILGPQFGKDARKTAVIITVIYDLKLAGAAFRSTLLHT